MKLMEYPVNNVLHYETETLHKPISWPGMEKTTPNTTKAHIHQHNTKQPFYGPLSGLPGWASTRRNTHPPTTWSASNLYQLVPSTTSHSILPVQITCLAIFHGTCPYHHNLFWCTINIISSIPGLSLNSLLGTLFLAKVNSVQRRKVWLTPTTRCRAVTLPRRKNR